MFEVRLQTYWSDVDAAGIVYYQHFFRFVEQAEEELFRAAGQNVKRLMEEHQIWMPRVEAFSKFSKPIKHGSAIRVRLNPRLIGEKTIRYDFEIVDDQSEERQAAGYVTVVAVDFSFKSTRIPEGVRAIIENA